MSLLFLFEIPRKLTLSAATGTYNIVGSAATLAVGEPAASGVYVIAGTGSAPGLLLSLTSQAPQSAIFAVGMPAGTGAYVISGNADLAVGEQASSGSYTISGSDGGFAVGMPVGAGAYVISGSAVLAKLSPTTNYMLLLSLTSEKGQPPPVSGLVITSTLSLSSAIDVGNYGSYQDSGCSQ